MNRKRGAALLVALAVLAGLVSLVAVLSTGFKGDVRSQMDRMNQRRAGLMAEAGLQRAIAELQQMRKGVATLNDSWATVGSRGAVSFQVGNDTFRVQVLDSGSKVNINSADAESLKKLPLTSDQVDAMMDWREKKPDPRPSGAKDEFYNSLAKPYNAKLQPFGSTDELLQVRDFSPAVLFDQSSHAALADLVTTDSSSADLDPTGHQKLDIHTATAQQLISMGVANQLANALAQSVSSFQNYGDALKFQGMDQASAKAILNYCQIGTTPTQSGKINLNTAPAAILSSVPNLDSDVASAIGERQSSGFAGLGDLVDIPGLDLPTLAKVVDRFCVSSRAFDVRVIGSAAGSFAAMEAHVTLDDSGNVNIIRWQPAPFINAAPHWGWADQSSQTETVAGLW